MKIKSIALDNKLILKQGLTQFNNLYFYASNMGTQTGKLGSEATSKWFEANSK